jgi:hypothetical protein
MAEAYPLILCHEVSLEHPRATVVGNVDGAHERGVFLLDKTGRIRLNGVPTSIKGLVEVWGDVNRNGELDCKGHTVFNDSAFDFESHAQIIEYMRKFQDLY